MMKWENLYATTRIDDVGPKVHNPDKLRTSFIRDYDRLIFSAAFRRLQNKTQVFPLPGVVFVHNRLTHSLEVASVGRSLGKAIGLRLTEKYSETSTDFKDFYNNELGNVIASACLAHDIGNPPFGHSGEDAIRNYFINLKGDVRRILQQELSTIQLADFENFEGNSNALRVLTHPFNEKKSSYNLTLTTLAAIIKYPCNALEGFNKKTGLISTKKSGYFEAEKATFQRIAQLFELPKIDGYQSVYARHPFVFLTEAADDICYRIIDIEDAHRLGIVSLQEMMDLFLPFFQNETGYNAADKVLEQFQDINDTNQKAQYLRARWIGLMIQYAAVTFIDNEEAILQGTLNDGLMEKLPPHFTALLERITAFSVERIYNNKHVVEIELAGYNVIGTLLETFVEAIVYPQQFKSKRLLHLIGSQYNIDFEHQTLYQNILSIVDCVSGMTDIYAMDLYRKIKGIDITSLQQF